MCRVQFCEPSSRSPRSSLAVHAHRNASVLAGAGVRQGSSGKVRLSHCLACLLIGREHGLERQVCRGERVGFGAALGEYVLHGAHLFEVPRCEPQAMATWEPRRGAPAFIDPMACSGLSAERKKKGLRASPRLRATSPLGERTTRPSAVGGFD